MGTWKGEEKRATKPIAMDAAMKSQAGGPAKKQAHDARTTKPVNIKTIK
jgi:hypothetical protein